MINNIGKSTFISNEELSLFNMICDIRKGNKDFNKKYTKLLKYLASPENVVLENNSPIGINLDSKLQNDINKFCSLTKKESEELHIKTKTTIETLTDENAYMLLEKKWIEPLVQNILELPKDVIHALSDKIKALSEKYAITFASVEKDIREAEIELSSLIGDLTGNEYDMKGLEELQALLNGN